jgi:hypothetical protein
MYGMTGTAGGAERADISVLPGAAPCPPERRPFWSRTVVGGREGFAIECTVRGNAWHFTCPHCRTKHLHGNGPGHRVAHCIKPGSPFAATGYWIIRKQRRRRA